MKKLDDLMKSLEGTKRSDKTKQKDEAMKTRSRSILESFEYIVELAEDSNLDKDFFEKAAKQILFASRKLKLTPMQVVLLAIFVDKSEDSRIMPSEIATYAGCRTTKILRLSDEIDVLESLHYLRASRSSRSVSYRVPAEVLKALRKNEPYIHVTEPVTNTQLFFDRFAQMMEDMNADEYTHETLMKDTLGLLEEIKDSVFATQIRRTMTNEEMILLFVYMAHLFVENNDNNIMFSDIENLYDDDKIPAAIKGMLRSRNSPLFMKGLIENVNEDGLARQDAFKLTDMAKDEFLSELNISGIGRSDYGLLKANTLTPKDLIYNKVEKGQVAELSALLTDGRFNEVQKRLSDAGMRSGFCCLFYGSPGTGKTETVYQLARATGRDIMRVDIDKIKSCWVGESEKNIKLLFDRYRAICKHSKLTPILLFNEADAVLGVRMEGASRAVDKMENSIQNIILQEMETLEGIMIATTNLTTNLDKAFERRFLYKIRFDKPTVESRAKIWQTMLKGLSGEDALELAVQFDLSGGEIENIVRKHSVNAILSGKEIIDLEEIASVCRHERISSNHKAVGFAS